MPTWTYFRPLRTQSVFSRLETDSVSVVLFLSVSSLVLSGCLNFRNPTSSPSVSLTSPSGVLKGGATQTLSYKTESTKEPLTRITLYYAPDGTTYTSQGDLSLTANSYSWTVPSDNTVTAKLKLIGVDGKGKTSTAESKAFTIDSTAPSAPSVTRTSSTPSNQLLVTFSIANCTDTAFILANESTQPSASSTSWVDCASTGSYVIVGDGTHNVKVWAKDLAGNVSATAGTVTMVHDGTGPTLSLTSLTGGQTISGNASISPAINTQSITWTASDAGAGLTGTPISLSYSTNGGTSWTSIVTGLANSGSYTWTVPALDSSTIRVRATAVDSAGNSSNSSSSSNLIVDSTIPTLSATSINDAATYATTASISAKVTATDSNSVTHVKVAEANSGTSECESEFAGASWVAYTNATTAIPITVSATDGTKKVCAWVKDSAGNYTNISPAAGTVNVNFDTIVLDSTAPAAPSVTLTSGTPSNQLLVTFSIANCTDTTHVLANESTQPSASSGAWVTCAASESYLVVGDGTHNVKVWAKDAAGNVSATAGTVTMVHDATNPSVTLTSLTGGQVISGNATISPAINTQSITWTASDAGSGLTGTPISLSYSSDSGSTWTSITTGLANSGTYTWTVPVLDSSTIRVRATAIDSAGNTTSSSSSSNFTVDSTIPTVTAVTINDGSTYAGTPSLALKVTASDSAHSITHVKLALANAGTSECQSEFAGASWVAYTNSTTPISKVVSAADGTKKICAWAKDTAGNYTSISPAAGTLGTNFDTIEFQTGNVPNVTTFTVTRTAGGSVITSGDAMTIAWAATDVEGLENNPVNISYTTDNSTWKDIYTDLTIANSANETWVGGLTGNPTSGSDTITTWTAPTSSYFRLKIVAKDFAGNKSSYLTSNPLNTGGWSVYAGTLQRGDGGAGKSATLSGWFDGKHFAVHPTRGDIYAYEINGRIRKLDATTGLVSTFLEPGTPNFVDGGALAATPSFNPATIYTMTFDRSGRLYIHVYSPWGSGIGTLWQVDTENRTSRIYIPGGTDYSPTATLAAVRADGGFAFDESNNLYFFAACTSANLPGTNIGYRMFKLTQNSDGTPNALSHIAGDCTTNPPVSGQPATNVGIRSYYGYLSDIAVWDNGSKIFACMYGGGCLKINGGTSYLSNLGERGSSSMIYSPTTGKVIASDASGGLLEVTMNMSSDNGETATTLVASSGTSGTCNQDGVAAASACILGSMRPQINSEGRIIFTDGILTNNQGGYRVRYVDDSGNLQTLFGSLPFYGDGLNATVARGEFKGIYYKKSSEPNQMAFPEGLYFMEPKGMVFGKIDPTTKIVDVLWGNQKGAAELTANGTVISKNKNMGTPYSAGNGYFMTFDENGLPWLRTNYSVQKIAADHTVTSLGTTTGSIWTTWDSVADGGDPWTVGSGMIYTGYENLTVYGGGLFQLGSYYYGVTGPNPKHRIMYFDYANSIAIKLLGGNALAASIPTSGADTMTPGDAQNTTLDYYCVNASNRCSLAYRPDQNRLYYSEGPKLRYISDPLNIANSTVTTVFTAAVNVRSISFNPSRNQLWWLNENSGALICYDFGSGRSWCDNSTNHFANALSFTGFSTFGNQLTWKDDTTLYMSTGAGEILQYVLPTTP